MPEIRMIGRVSPVGLGFWQAGGRMWKSPTRVDEIVRAALDYGINLFDTAEIYGWGTSEKLLGEALRLEDPSGEAIVASKIPPFRAFYASARRAVEGIRRRLNGRLDLIQLHWPPPYWAPLCRFIRIMERLVAEGLVGAYGVSNFPANLLRKALECSKRYEPVVDQVQYSLVYRSPENHILPFSSSHGIQVLAWSPLAKGALAGATRPSDPAQRTDRVFRAAARDNRLQDAIDRVAEETGLTRSGVALAWLVSKRAIPIPGTRRPSRVREYARAMRGLDERHVRLLDEASRAYLRRWGERYRALQGMRLVPCVIQYVALRLVGGV